MITIEAPWEAQLNWAEDCKRDSYVFDAIDNQIAGPVSMDEAILVAAAPDLLEQLEALVDLIRKHETDLGSKAFAKAIDYHLFFVTSAIKKAKGN